MSEDDMLKCLIAFVLGYLIARMMRGNGLSVDTGSCIGPIAGGCDDSYCKEWHTSYVGSTLVGYPFCNKDINMCCTTK